MGGSFSLHALSTHNAHDNPAYPRSPSPPSLPPRSLRSELGRTRELLAESAAVESGYRAQVARLSSDVAGEQARSLAEVGSMQAALRDLRLSLAAKGRTVGDLQGQVGDVEALRMRTATAEAEAAAWRARHEALLESVGQLAHRTSSSPSPVLLARDVASAVAGLLEAARGATAGEGGSTLPPNAITGDSLGDASLREAVASAGPLDRAYVTIARLEAALAGAHGRVASLEREVTDVRWRAAKEGVIIPPAASASAASPAAVTPRAITAGAAATTAASPRLVAAAPFAFSLRSPPQPHASLRTTSLHMLGLSVGAMQTLAASPGGGGMGGSSPLSPTRVPSRAAPPPPA